MGEDNETWCEQDGVIPPPLLIPLVLTPLTLPAPPMLLCFWWCLKLPVTEGGCFAGDDDEWWLNVSGDTITAVGDAGDGSNWSPGPRWLLHLPLSPLTLFGGIVGQLKRKKYTNINQGSSGYLFNSITETFYISLGVLCIYLYFVDFKENPSGSLRVVCHWPFSPLFHLDHNLQSIF